LVQHFFEIP